MKGTAIFDTVNILRHKNGLESQKVKIAIRKVSKSQKGNPPLKEKN